MVGFLGPNGSGKTTTIRLLMGLLRPSAGRASILGRDCHHDAVALKRDIGYLPDEPFLYPYLTGDRDAGAGGGLHGLAPPRRAAARARSPSGWGWAPAAGAYTVTYSLGMKKRLALALALIHEPRVLIMDEPTNGLDPAGARQMRATISELAAGGRTIFLSTHLLDAAERLCHRVAIIQRGKLRRWGRRTSCAPDTPPPETTLEELFLRVDGAGDRELGPTRSRAGGDLLIRFRLRSCATGCGRAGGAVAAVRLGRWGVIIALAYTGLFTQAFSVIAHTVGSGPGRGAGAGGGHDQLREPGGARGQQRGGPRGHRRRTSSCWRARCRWRRWSRRAGWPTR